MAPCPAGKDRPITSRPENCSQKLRDGFKIAATSNTKGRIYMNKVFTGFDQPSSSHVPKYDMRLGPDSDGKAAATYRQFTEMLYTLTFAPGSVERFHFHAVTYQLPRAAVSSTASVAQTLDRGPT